MQPRWGKEISFKNKKNLTDPTFLKGSVFLWGLKTIWYSTQVQQICLNHEWIYSYVNWMQHWFINDSHRHSFCWCFMNIRPMYSERPNPQGSSEYLSCCGLLLLLLCLWLLILLLLQLSGQLKITQGSRSFTLLLLQGHRHQIVLENTFNHS